jgi:hypothetical protein
MGTSSSLQDSSKRQELLHHVTAQTPRLGRLLPQHVLITLDSGRMIDAIRGGTSMSLVKIGPVSEFEDLEAGKLVEVSEQSVAVFNILSL